MATVKKDERTTMVTGFYVDVANNGEQIQFELETEYARSINSAKKAVAKLKEWDENFIIVTSFENETAKKFKWMIPELMRDFTFVLFSENEAKTARENHPECKLVKFELYDYHADVFGYDQTEKREPLAMNVSIQNQTFKATKGDARRLISDWCIEESADFSSVVFVNNTFINTWEFFVMVPKSEVERYKKYLDD